MKAKREQHTIRVPGYPSFEQSSITLVTALRIVRQYRDRVPTAREVMRDFEVSRATAYRWARAIREESERAA